MKFVQINLHNGIASIATLCQQFASGMADVALIQEPWITRGQIRGLTNSGGTGFSVVSESKATSCISVKNHIHELPFSEFCSRDAIMVRISC
jgi:hypothetical protein